MAKKKKIEEVKVIKPAEEKVEKIIKPEVAPKAEIQEPAKRSKMYRARIVRKKLIRE